MHALATDLYPLCRSITGEGLRETLRRLQKHVPLEIHEVKSGTQVLDWTVPKEWNIRDAYVADAKGTRVATVGEDGKVTMKAITVERDTGQTLQISVGLDGSERIVKLANAELTDGSKVEVIEAPPAQAQAAPAPAQK